jgi:hypothetical protein
MVQIIANIVKKVEKAKIRAAEALNIVVSPAQLGVSPQDIGISRGRMR